MSFDRQTSHASRAISAPANAGAFMPQRFFALRAKSEIEVVPRAQRRAMPETKKHEHFCHL